MSLAEFDVTGQKVLITGAGRGIGKGIALAFAEAGADVAITGLTDTVLTPWPRKFGLWVRPPSPDRRRHQSRRNGPHRRADPGRVRPS